MKYTLLTIMCLVLATPSVCSQSFEHYYDSGIGQREICFSATPLADGRIAVAAYRRAISPVNQAVVFFTDTEGTVDTLMLGPTNRLNSPRWVHEISGGRLLLSASVTPGPSNRIENWVFTILDNDYSVIGRRSFGNLGNDEQLRNVELLEDGNILASGELGERKQMLVALFNDDLDIIWSSALTDPGGGLIIGSSAAQTSDGYVVGAHERPPGSSVSHRVICRYASDGTLIWSNIYVNANEMSPHGAEIVPVDDGYLMLDEIVRGANTELSLLRVNTAGEVVDYGYFSGPTSVRMQDVIALPGGDLILAGMTAENTNESKGLLVRMSDDGDIVWARAYERAEPIAFVSVRERTDGNPGYLIAGHGTNCGGEDDDVLLLAVDEDGRSDDGCGLEDVAFTWVPSTVTQSPFGTASTYNFGDGLPLDLSPGTSTRSSFFCPTFYPDPDQSSGSERPLEYVVPEACAINAIGIVDSDAAFISSGVLDSFTISLSAAVPEDVLLYTGSANAAIRGAGTQRISIAGPISTDEVVDILSAIVIDDPSGALGQRTVEMTAFAGCEVSPVGSSTFRATGQETVSSTLPDTLAFCPEDTVQLITGLPAGYTINWSNGAIGDSLSVTSAATYSLVAVSDCNELIDSVVVVEQMAGLAPFNDLSFALCLGDTVRVDAGTIGATNYTWSDNGDFGATRSFFTPGSYLLTATTACDTASYEVMVTTQNCCEIYIPNAFSPNADGVNDVFLPASGARSCNLISGWSLRVYDRWGGEIFASSDPDAGWDGRSAGKQLDPGVYAFVLEYFDGLNQRLEVGDVTLLR